MREKQIRAYSSYAPLFTKQRSLREFFTNTFSSVKVYAPPYKARVSAETAEQVCGKFTAFFSLYRNSGREEAFSRRSSKCPLNVTAEL